ncbi:MAG: hypothetical protein U0441_29220 [Polyangiaceae bacterium]
MTFPKRWSDDDAAPTPMKDLLRAGKDDMDPPDGAENAVWLALAAKIGTSAATAGASAKAAAAASAKTAATVSASVGATGAGAGASAAVGGGLLKSILIGVVSGVVAVTGYTALAPTESSAPPANVVTAPEPLPARADSPAPRGNTPAPSAEPVIAPPPSSQPSGAPAPSDAPSPSSQPSAAPSPSSDATSAAVSPPSQATDATGSDAPAPGSAEDRERLLREEREMVNQARTALRGGDTGGAMRLLEQARVKFPNGALGQEREALAIETLAKSGAKEAASARAAAFIKAHPTSPHAARLQLFVLP